MSCLDTAFLYTFYYCQEKAEKCGNNHTFLPLGEGDQWKQIFVLQNRAVVKNKNMVFT